MKKNTQPIPPLLQKSSAGAAGSRPCCQSGYGACLFEIGRMIVEEEQQGHARAAYGKQTLRELSQRLTERFGKGFRWTTFKT